MAKVFLIEPLNTSTSPLSSAIGPLRGIRAEVFSKGVDAVERLARRGEAFPDAIAINALQPHGIVALVHSLLRLVPQTPILLLMESDYQHVLLGSESFGQGIETLCWPASAEQIQTSLLRMIQLRARQSPLAYGEGGLAGLVGNSAHLSQIILRAKAYARGRHHLLLRGERGTGKTLLAQSMLQEEGASPAMLQTHLLSGSSRLETLFSECPPGSSMILDLPEKPPVGQTVSELAVRACLTAGQYDLRLILCQRLHPKGKRKAQFSELPDDGPVTVNFLPLRSRPEDIIAQFSTFSQRSAIMLNRPAVQLNEEALHQLLNHSWPGNTRELLYFVFQLYMTYDGPAIDEEQVAAILNHSMETFPDFPHEATSQSRQNAIDLLTKEGELRDWESIEADYLRQAFQYYRGRKSVIARKTGLGRSTLYRKAKNLDIA